MCRQMFYMQNETLRTFRRMGNQWIRQTAVLRAGL